MGRFKTREHKIPDEIELLGLADVLARSHPRDRAVPGIYFLIRGTEIVYVGQSKNLPVRIQQHRRKNGMEFDRFTVYPCAASLLDKMEQHYIAMFRPPYNGSMKLTAEMLSGEDARHAYVVQRDWQGSSSRS
jgi:hypothetical protein